MSHQEEHRLIPGWEQVISYLEQWLKSCSSLAVMGIGNDLRGDDGAGPRLIRLLEEKTANYDNLRLIDASTVPENHIGTIVQAAPSHLLLIDAAHQEGDPPGRVRIVKEEEIGNFSSSTHTLSLTLVIGLIKQQTPLETVLVGIQPETAGFFDETLSSAVEETVRGLAEWLAERRYSRSI